MDNRVKLSYGENDASISRCCDDEKGIWCCVSNGRHNPNTMKVWIDTNECRLVQLCQDHIDHTTNYGWQNLILKEDQ